MQAFNKNYFQLFDLTETFDIDSASLTEKFHQLQSEAHPDRVASGNEQERLLAVQLSSLLNEAYGTLKTPIKRAGYLLGLKGLDVERVSQGDLGMDLLMEQIQLREAVAELPQDDSALPALGKLKKEVAAKLDVRQQAFASDFELGKLENAKRTYHELQFLHKLLSDIDSSEEQRLGY